MGDELNLEGPWSARVEDRIDVHLLNGDGEMIGWVAGREGFPSALVARAICAAVNAGEASVPVTDTLQSIAEKGHA